MNISCSCSFTKR